MPKLQWAAGLAGTALMAGPALAQMNSAPTQLAGSGQVITHMTPNLMRGSKLMDMDVYGADNQKIGSIDEVLVTKDGRIQAVVIGAGGLLGIGKKAIAIPYDQVQWTTYDQAWTAAGRTAPATNVTGGVTTLPGPGVMPPAGEPATTGSSGAAGSAATTGAGTGLGAPDRAMVRMSKTDLQNAPEFRYGTINANRAGRASNTNLPPTRTNHPSIMLQQ